jgi:hypothetical protein
VLIFGYVTITHRTLRIVLEAVEIAIPDEDQAVEEDQKKYDHIKPLKGTQRAKDHDHGVDII